MTDERISDRHDEDAFGAADATAALESPRSATSATDDDARVAPRHRLRALASCHGGTPLTWRRIAELRPQVDSERARLLAQLRQDGSRSAYLEGRSRLVDGLVIGLGQLARVCVGDGHRAMVPTLAAVRIGAHGPAHLSRSLNVEVLFLVATAAPLRERAEAMATFIGAALAELGVPLRCAVRSVDALTGELRSAALLHGMPAERPRFLWGCYGLYQQLIERVAAVVQ